MRKALVCSLAAAIAVSAAPVASGDHDKAGVKTKVFISNALLTSGGDVELLGGLKASNDTCLERRKVVVFEGGGDKLGATKAKDGAWEFTTGAIGTGDSAYAKVKRKAVRTDDGRVLCKGGESKTFDLG